MNENKSVIIIPSRYNSKRYKGKPFAKIKGITLIERIWRIAKKVATADDVIIATDNEEILKHCLNFGANVVLTSQNCRNGTERIAEVAAKLDNFDYNIIINFQGDAVLTPHWIIEAVIEKMRKNPNVSICTPATKINHSDYEKLKESKKNGKISGTTVTFSKSYKALYFSKNIIPFIRNKIEESEIPIYKHIGLYGYKKDKLMELVRLPETPLEKCEGLEQLRALENDIPIDIVLVDYKGRSAWSIDNPEDISIVEKIIDREGEIINL